MKAEAFANFNKTLLWIRDIDWLDNTGVTKLDENRIVKISLQTCDDADQYQKYRVTIVHRSNGPIDTKDFVFKDYLDPLKRVDQGRVPVEFSVWYLGEIFNWYPAIPTDTTPLTRAIERYIELFR